MSSVPNLTISTGLISMWIWPSIRFATLRSFHWWHVPAPDPEVEAVVLGKGGRIYFLMPPGSDQSELEDTAWLLKAVAFAAGKHRGQRRKGEDASPYINHPLEVAELLTETAAVRDVKVLMAAVLHDTIEDTRTTPEELEAAFGREVCALVQEVTDDKSLSKEERKRRQIEHAPQLSSSAKLIKVADKIANVRDVTDKPPTDWSLGRRLNYLDWAERVVAGCRGVSEPLEREFDAVLKRARDTIR